MPIAIKIENLFKEYRLGVIGHGTLYRDLQSWWASARGKEDPNSLIGHSRSGDTKSQILALNNITPKTKTIKVTTMLAKTCTNSIELKPKNITRNSSIIETIGFNA